MVGQAHLDPVWLWRWTEGRAEALATCASAADRLDEFPEFVFTRGESQVYAWVAEEDPALHARILAHIRAGRWSVVNGMVIQPDMNLPQGESLVRQALLGKRWMREHLQIEPRVAYCVDSFGHAGTLPQILRGCGFDAYVFMRPQEHELGLPARAFWWQGPDGSRVLAFRIAGAYTYWRDDPSEQIERALAGLPPNLDHTMCFYGVGNHGGGPTKRQIAAIRQIAAEREDVELRFSAPDAFFEAIRPTAASLPTFAAELQEHAVGCYALVSSLKRVHRKAECGLLRTERLAVQAEMLVGAAAPRERLDELWHVLCFNQFHDTLGGTCIKSATDDAMDALSHVIHSAAEIADDAGRRIASQLDTRGAGGSFVLFNPFPEPFQGYVEYEPWTGWQRWRANSWQLTDDAGHPIEHQPVESEEAMRTERSEIARIVFRADLPPLGYRLYRFVKAEDQATKARGLEDAKADGWGDGVGMSVSSNHAITQSRNHAIIATDTTLENEHLTVRIDPESGAIISCVERVSGVELVGSGGWNVAQVHEDPSDTWAHGVTHFESLVGAFGAARVAVVDAGLLQASLLVERRFGASVWVQQLVLRAGERELLLRNWLHWHGRWQVVKLAFDIPSDAPDSAHDAPFGWVARQCDGAEVPTQQWMDVSGPLRGHPELTVGVALLNDGKYGCDVRDSTARLTILRSPPYAYHVPHEPGTKHRYDWVDQGEQCFTLAVRPHLGDWRDAGVVAAARALNMPPLAVTSYGHAGSLAPQGVLAALEAPELELTALKPAENGDGYIMRLADRHGRGGSGVLRWLGEVFPVACRPFEVVTLRIVRRGDVWKAEACDMIERAIDSEELRFARLR
jgi:alpha-mannosidase